MEKRKFTAESVEPRIREFLEPLLEKAGFQVTLCVTEPEARFPNFENPDIVVDFSGRDVDDLLSNRGELLLALEHLTMEMLHLAPNEHNLLVFDANDYRMLRIEELRISAATAAERVQVSRRPFRFGPMTSRERRILHLAIREFPGLRSESSGNGPHRGVVVYGEGMATLPDEPPPPRRPHSRRPPSGRPPRRR